MSDSARPLPDATRIRRAALTASDPDELGAFYRDVVGLEVLARDSTATTLGVDGTPLLELFHDADARARTGGEAGLYHTAFLLPSRGALGDALTRIRERWRLDGASDHDVSEALYLTDPEGNGVEIYRDRPRDAWRRKADGDLRIGSHPLDLEALAADAAGESATAVPAGTTVGHVHLEVSSVDAARAFYVDGLGFDVMMDASPSALFLGAGGYHHHLGVNTWHRREEPIDPDARGLAWFELVVPVHADLEAIRGRLEARARGGAGVSEIDGGLAVTDPDGIRIRLVAEK